MSGVLVETPGRKEKWRQVESTAIFASKRANRIPTHPRGPWPKAWNAYLRKGNGRDRSLIRSHLRMPFGLLFLAEVFWVELVRVRVMCWIHVNPTDGICDEVILLQAYVGPW